MALLILISFFLCCHYVGDTSLCKLWTCASSCIKFKQVVVQETQNKHGDNNDDTDDTSRPFKPHNSGGIHASFMCSIRPKKLVQEKKLAQENIVQLMLKKVVQSNVQVSRTRFLTVLPYCSLGRYY